MRNDRVQELIAQLNQLQLQQTALLQRLDTAISNETTLSGDIGQEAQEPTGFAIGDNVTIKNPNPFQSNEGTITKLGKRRVTVTTPTGQKILRAPKNLTIKPATIQ
jgi:hypothetical protein